jgi:hypothetical protein
MAFPTTSLLDDFNRSNTGPPPSASWLSGTMFGEGGLKVVSNALTFNAASWCSAVWGTTYGPAQEAFITIASGSYATFGVYGRLTNPTESNITGYEVYAHGADTWDIWRIDSSTEATQLGASVSRAYTSGQKIGIEISGNTITAWHYSSGAWTSVMTRTDATYAPAASYLGVEINGGVSCTLDDFYGGAIVSPVTFLARQNQAIQQAVHRAVTY